MKKPASWNQQLVLGLTILVTLGCGLTAPAVPTPTPTLEPTSTPTLPPTATATSTSTPTRTPRPTATPLPDLSRARIFLSELPTGFEEIPGEEFAEDGGDGSQSSTQFAFINTDDFHMIFGTNVLLLKQTDRIGFEFALNQPEVAMKELVSAMGTTDIRDEKLLEGFEDIGEARVAMTMIADMEGIPVRVDTLVLKREKIGGMVLSMSMTSQAPQISLHELGLLFDQHIQETLDISR